MLWPSFLRSDRPALEGRRVRLRLPVRADYDEWARVRGESRRFLEPWEPVWAPDELDRSAWRIRMSRYNKDYRTGLAISFFVFDADTDALLGGITLGNIRRGVTQSGHVGYWIGERYAGQGLMLDALVALSSYAFETLKLHRIEAACIPGNERSVRVLEKAGFQREGLLRSYLKINGVWQDHYLFALIEDDWRASQAKD
jgi:ribosomal-protein-alanine N-acetyltransferase